MKALKWIGGILLILILGFFAIGLVKPTVEYGHTITVDKPIDEAWEVYHDVSKYDQWLKGFKSMDLISGDPGAVGSKYKVVVKPAPDQPDFEMTETIISMKPNDHITLQFDADMMKFTQKATFRETADGTTITTDSEVFGSGAAMKSMFALMEMTTGSFQAQEEENYNNLKKVIENNVAMQVEEMETPKSIIE